jgi:uncharacterized protein
MSYVVVSVAALIVAALTLFSGFGLGTILMPVFALFFPVQVAVAATAVVHLANNIFKLALIGRWADYSIVAKFAIPGAIASAIGAALLGVMSGVTPLAQYELAGRIHEVTVLKLVIAVLIGGLTIVELLPLGDKFQFDRKYIPLGGAVSGFFGGLSGLQGALRTAFLVRAGLEKQAFLGTTVVVAVIVDISRLIVYGVSFYTKDFAVLQAQRGIGLVIAGSSAAFIGSAIGVHFVEKVTMRTINRVVGVLLLVLAVALGAGLV